MTTNIMSNKLNAAVSLHLTSNATLTIAGNSSVSSIATGGEVLTGAYIAQIHWACQPDSFIKITRGGYVVGIYDSSSYIDYAGCGMPLTKGLNLDLRVEFNGSANAYCIIEMQKVFGSINQPGVLSSESLNLDFINQGFSSEAL